MHPGRSNSGAQAGWRIASTRAMLPGDRVDRLATIGRPWVLEPSAPHLVELLRTAAADGEERRTRAAAGAAAARALDWDEVASRYARRLRALARRRPRSAGTDRPAPTRSRTTRRGGSWRRRRGAASTASTSSWPSGVQFPPATRRPASSCSRTRGSMKLPGELEAHAISAARRGGADLERAGDINLLMEPQGPERDARLHAAVNAYAVLHAGAPGHVRLAREACNAVFDPGEGAVAAALLAAALPAAA